MFTKILIANRGEIACRVIKTARRMGIATVAVYSDADANARHVPPGRRGGAHRPGAGARVVPASARRSSPPRKATGAQAVHPGYGFLSENDDFAEACADEGIVFIGPPAVGDPGDGLEVGGQDADGEGRRAAGARLPRRRPGPGAARARGRQDRLSGADQGQRRRRRQGHARGSTRARTSPPRSPRASARRRTRFGDDRGAGRAVRAAAAPHRDPGVRRHARRLRLPVRARLLGAAPPPEGARGSAGAGHDRRAPRRDGRGRGRGGARRSATSAPARSSSSPTRTAASTSWR